MTAFSVSVAAAQWTLTFYLLGFGLSQLVYGPLTDCLGRRNVLLISFLIFILGCLLCVVSHNISMLLISRFIAGIGGGASGVINRAIAS